MNEGMSDQLKGHTKNYLRIPLTNSVHTGPRKEDRRNGIKEQCVGNGSKTQ